MASPCTPPPIPPLSNLEDLRKPEIRELGERLDAHRKSRQAAHPDLTLTGLYNVLAQLRSADRLAQPGPESEALEQEILTRLVTLNRERAAEEAKGHIRWLRPDFQNPGTEQSTTLNIEVTPQGLTPAPASTHPWPAALPARVALIKSLLNTLPPDSALLAKHLTGPATPKRKSEITAILETLKLLGQI